MDNIIKISVRNIVEFALKSGSIDTGFAARSVVIEGTKGHRALQKIREGTEMEYKPEVPIVYNVYKDEIVLEINGRMDGLFIKDDIYIVEEIKTTERNLEAIDEDYNILHWAQAKCYAYMHGILNGSEKVGVQLTYYHRRSKETKCFLKLFSMDELEAFFYNVVNKYLKWAKMLREWNEKRDLSIQDIKFPFEKYRRGQREFAVAAYKTITSGKKLFAKAPTGIGKTIATIFPSIKAVGEGQISKVFYLTAKTVTRNIAEEAYENLRRHGLKFKTVTLTAKDKICPQEKKSCKPEDCPYARGYYDRIDDAVEDIMELENYSKSRILEYSNKHMVCPFEFSLDLSLFCDGIICDYNYVFDPRAHLKRFFTEIKEDYGFLIDEAHNLVDRAREMFSAELLKSNFLDMKNDIDKEYKALRKCLNNINSFFIEQRKVMEKNNQYNLVIREQQLDINEHIEELIEISEELLSKGNDFDFKEKLLELYFECINYLKISEFYDERYITYFERIGNDIKLKLFCLDPSKLLKESMKRGKSTILFSATFSPMDYFRDILGGDEDDYKISIESPFDSENLCLMIENKIKTQYSVREFSYQRVAEYINSVISSRKGNYIVFFPSYKYLNEVYNVFLQDYSGVNTICQKGNMTEEEREMFLNSFDIDNDETLIGFAVMGGAFGEGVDLTGDRLIGAIIVGVGLPQICLERDIIKTHFSEKNSMGFEYAYVYPGMNKVLQAAGRVIRTEKDRGIVFLIDERFSRNGYMRLMPSEWQDIKWIKGTEDLSKTLTEFWSH